MLEIVAPHLTHKHTHTLRSFCLSWGVPCRLDLGGSQFTTSLPGSGKSGPGSILCLTPGGGVAPPNTPFPAARPGGGGAQILGAGRASVASPSRPPWPASRCPPAPRLSPHLFPRQLRSAGGPGQGQGLATHQGQCAAAGPAGTKCSGPGPGSSRRPTRLGRAVCKHKVSQGAGERVSELGSWTSRRPSPHPDPWGPWIGHLPVRPGRSVRAPARQPARGMGLARVAARARRHSPGLPLRAAPLRSDLSSADRRAPQPLGGIALCRMAWLSPASDRPSPGSGDAPELAPAPGLRDPGVPAPGPALVPARAPPRRAAAACAAPCSRAGGLRPGSRWHCPVRGGDRLRTPRG